MQKARGFIQEIAKQIPKKYFDSELDLQVQAFNLLGCKGMAAGILMNLRMRQKSPCCSPQLRPPGGVLMAMMRVYGHFQLQ